MSNHALARVALREGSGCQCGLTMGGESRDFGFNSSFSAAQFFRIPSTVCASLGTRASVPQDQLIHSCGRDDYYKDGYVKASHSNDGYFIILTLVAFYLFCRCCCSLWAQARFL